MRAGDRVTLRSPSEILATLDNEGSLGGLPFMPEMLRYFGRTFTVSAKVARACDTIEYTGVRRLRDTVLLDDVRCDGSGHAGCGAQCRLYWNERWLRRTGKGEIVSSPAGSDLTDLSALVRTNAKGRDFTPAEPTFRCQATELLRASEAVGWYDLGSLLHELTSGNVALLKFLRVMARMVFEEIGGRVGLVSTKPFRPHEIRGGPAVNTSVQGLQAGDLVQIRTKAEIRDTLGPTGKNRGLWFDREMVPYCGRTARVRAKVERFIDEGSGRLVELKSDCYILDGVVCQGTRSDKRWFCPRAIYPWWRESWLEPLEELETSSRTDKPNPPLGQGAG